MSGEKSGNEDAYGGNCKKDDGSLCHLSHLHLVPVLVLLVLVRGTFPRGENEDLDHLVCGEAGGDDVRVPALHVQPIG